MGTTWGDRDPKGRLYKNWTEQFKDLVNAMTGRSYRIRAEGSSYFCEFCQIVVPLEVPHGCSRAGNSDQHYRKRER